MYTLGYTYMAVSTDTASKDAGSSVSMYWPSTVTHAIGPTSEPDTTAKINSTR